MSRWSWRVMPLHGSNTAPRQSSFSLPLAIVSNKWCLNPSLSCPQSRQTFWLPEGQVKGTSTCPRSWFCGMAWMVSQRRLCTTLAVACAFLISTCPKISIAWSSQQMKGLRLDLISFHAKRGKGFGIALFPLLFKRNWFRGNIYATRTRVPTVPI